MSKISKTLEIKNLLGLHARPASMIVQVASAFQSEVHITNLTTNSEADGKSVMSLLILAAPKGTPIRIDANGPDAEAVMKQLEDLFNGGFNDD